jgi:hypothetical protein
MSLATGQGPAPGEERFFELHRILAAARWARQGGIAVHRNFEVDGMRIGRRVRQGMAYHVFGQREALLAWGRRNAQRPAWLQDADEFGDFEGVYHFDVFGQPARRLEERLEIPPPPGGARDA